MEMPAESAGKYMSAIPKVAQAVKAATGCDAISILSNLGEHAGQKIDHPHVHIVPRKKDDGLLPTVPAEEDLNNGVAEAIQAKIQAALRLVGTITEAVKGALEDKITKFVAKVVS